MPAVDDDGDDDDVEDARGARADDERATSSGERESAEEALGGLIRRWGEIYFQIACENDGACMRAVKLREKLDGLRRTVTRVERGPVGANETLKKQVKCLEELIPTVEAREAEERAARRMSAEFTTMAVMAEKSMSPRRGESERRRRSVDFEKFEFDGGGETPKTKTKTPGKNATDALSKTLDALNAEHGLEGCPPEQFYGSAARTPGSNGSRQVDAALGRPRAAAAGTMLSTFFRRSTPKTEFHVPTGGARTRGAASAGSSDASGDKKTSTILSPERRTSTRRKKADPIMVDLLDDSDEEGKKNEANPAVQNLAPMNLTSEGDEPRRSTRSSRYRSLQHEVGNLSAMFPDSKTKGAVQITLGDLEHLKDGEMLNDQCVDFFLRYIQVETIGKNTPELLERVHFFNSFFYQKLVRKSHNQDADVDAATAAYQGVKGWTKGVDIFSKDYLMIPVHSGLHWSLIIVCYANEGEGREPMILHLDSMSPAGGHNSETVTRAIRKYLNKEWQARSNSGDGVKFTAKVMPAYRVNVPRQQNGCDCGVFILAFVERFLSDCPKVLTKEIVQRATQKHRGLSYEPKEKFLRKHWFPNEVVDELRMKMTLLVIDCVRSQLGADDASGIILTRAYDMTLKELEWRQAQTKQAEYKASREIKRRIHEAEEAKRRKLEPTVVDGDVGDGDGDDDDDDDGEDDFKISITRKPPAQPEPPSRSTTRFAGSNWSKSRTKEPVRETRQTKILPTQAFSGKSYKLGRSSPTTARAPTVNNGAWQTGNRTLQQRYLRGKEREDSERKETQEKLADTIAETKRSAGLLERLAANRNQRRD